MTMYWAINELLLQEIETKTSHLRRAVSCSALCPSRRLVCQRTCRQGAFHRSTGVHEVPILTCAAHLHAPESQSIGRALFAVACMLLLLSCTYR